jgi:beta-glucosidase
MGVIACSIWIAGAASARQVNVSYKQAVARARLLVSHMTLDEQIDQLHGIHDAAYYRYVRGLRQLGIPSLNVTNGPAGVGSGGAGQQKPATALPAPIALALSWDPNLAYIYGRLAGEETRSLGSNLLEAPDVNFVRVPQGGPCL